MKVIRRVSSAGLLWKPYRQFEAFSNLKAIGHFLCEVLVEEILKFALRSKRSLLLPMQRLLYLRIALLALTLLNVCLPQDLVNAVKSTSATDFLALESVSRLPFIARDQLLLRISKPYSELTPREAFRFLQEEENRNSIRDGMKPLVPVLWRKGCSICSVEYSKGREYLTVRYGPLTVSISAGEFEKFTETLVVASLEGDSKVKIDVLPSNIQLVEIEPEISPLKMAAVQDVAKSVRHGAGWKAALIGGLGSMATREVYKEESYPASQPPSRLAIECA